MREEAHRNGEQLRQQLLAQHTQIIPTIHTDSGVRLTGEAALECELGDVPPGYTEL